MTNYLGKWSIKVDIKASGYTILFYVVAIMALFAIKHFEAEATRLYEVKYTIAAIAIRILLGLLLGGLAAYLGKRPKRSIQAVLLEAALIGLPALMLTLCHFTLFHMPVKIKALILVDHNLVMYIGAILLGVEMFRLVQWLKEKDKL